MKENGGATKMIEEAKVSVEDMLEVMSRTLCDAAMIWVLGIAALRIFFKNSGIPIPEPAGLLSFEGIFALLLAVPGVSITVVRIIRRIRKRRRERALVKK